MTETSLSPRVLDPQEIKAIDDQASLFMQEGIRLLQLNNDVDGALLRFDRAFELRRQLPIGVPVHAYGLAACWLNRAEALTRLDPIRHPLVLLAYEEAFKLLHALPIAEDPRFSKRLAIAYQNRALVLAAQNPPATAAAIADLVSAIAILEHSEAIDAPEREYILAVMLMNLANIKASESTMESDFAAREAANRALVLVKAREQEDPAAAEVGLKARHVLCQISARRLSAQTESEASMDDVHDATDLADEGLSLVQEWERRGVALFRTVASDLFRFGARVYAHYQPHFLHEFLSEQLDPRHSSNSYTQSHEIQNVVREIGLPFATS